MKRVAAAIIRRNNKLLICRRGAGGSCAFLWEFPGGKIEPGESPEACLVRECMEELGVLVKPERLYEKAAHTYPDGQVELTFYLAEITRGEPVKNVHTHMEWVTTQKLSGYPFCPADERLVHRLQHDSTIFE